MARREEGHLALLDAHVAIRLTFLPFGKEEVRTEGETDFCSVFPPLTPKESFLKKNIWRHF